MSELSIKAKRDVRVSFTWSVMKVAFVGIASVIIALFAVVLLSEREDQLPEKLLDPKISKEKKHHF